MFEERLNRRDYSESFHDDSCVYNAAINREFSFAVFLRYANALHSRDEPQCRVGLGKKVHNITFLRHVSNNIQKHQKPQNKRKSISKLFHAQTGSIWFHISSYLVPIESYEFYSSQIAQVAGFHLMIILNTLLPLVGPLSPLDSYQIFQPGQKMNSDLSVNPVIN